MTTAITKRKTGEDKPSMRQKGVALVTTLSLIALLSFTLVSYFALVAHDRSGTRHFLQAARAQMILEMAAQEALAKIMDGCELYDPSLGAGQWQDTSDPRATAHMTACPGMISVRYFDLPLSSGSDFDSASANPKRIPLFSWKSGSHTSTFNINTTRNPVRQGEFYITGYPEAENPSILVHWLPVYRDGAQPPSATNPITGRYAYWVDVENSKINLNTAVRPVEAEDWPVDLDSSPLELLNWWFKWQDDDTPPYVADNSAVDWDQILRTSPDSGSAQQVKDALTEHLAGLDSEQSEPFNFWSEVYSLLTSSSARSDRMALATVRKNLALSTTLYGRDGERDPLGKEKIDLISFLTTPPFASTRISRISMLTNNHPQWRELARRLNNAYYHRAYSPADNTTPRSFIWSLNGFAGNGNTNENSNGGRAMEQMLVNIVEYSKPHNESPYWDEESGVFGVKSMPYVVEVATRARSALWLLDESDRTIDNFILDGAYYTNDMTGRWPDGGSFTRENQWFLTNVIVDVVFSLVNPNLFATNTFTGEFSIDYQWESSPEHNNSTTNKTISGPFLQEPLHDQWEDGEGAVYFYLGTVPGAWIAEWPTALQIKGWEITQGTNTFHKVPLRHPNQSQNFDLRPWWAMAQQNINVGKTGHPHSLHDFQDINQRKFRAVGWFSPRAWNRADAFGTNSIYLNLPAFGYDSLEHGENNSTVIRAIQNFINSVHSSNPDQIAITNRLVCLDPALGHRTGNTDSSLRGLDGQAGHFYGILGHPWRHYDPDNPTITRVRIFDPRFPDVDADVEVSGFYSAITDEEEMRLRPAIRGSWMTSVGELGLVHSGMPQKLIPLTQSKGEILHTLNFPDSGPPIGMLLDVFAPGAFRNYQEEHYYTQQNWTNQSAPSPQDPRFGTWNVHSSIVDAEKAQRMASSSHGLTAWLALFGETEPEPADWPPSLSHFSSELDLTFSNYSQQMTTAMLANQITTDANAFTIHIVAQAIQDRAPIGSMDADDQVLAEQWAQMVVSKTEDFSDTAPAPHTQAPFRNQYRILHYQVLEKNQ